MVSSLRVVKTATHQERKISVCLITPATIKIKDLFPGSTEPLIRRWRISKWTSHILANIRMVEISTSPVYTRGDFCQRVSGYTNPNSGLRANKHWSLRRMEFASCLYFSFCSKSRLITGLICALDHLIAWETWNSDSWGRQTCWKWLHTPISVRSSLRHTHLHRVPASSHDCAAHAGHMQAEVNCDGPLSSPRGKTAAMMEMQNRTWWILSDGY